MRSYWVWLIILATTWLLALESQLNNIMENPIVMIGSTLFFAVYFLLPLYRGKKKLYFMMFGLLSLISLAVFWPLERGALNLFALLIYGLIAGKAVYRLPGWHAISVGVLLYLGAVMPYILDYELDNILYISFYVILLSSAFTAFYQISNQEQQLGEQLEVLRSEFRKVKRQLLTSERLARQEERAQIARDMHDSVGHRLTALLMQLEVAYMKASDEATKERLLMLKELAKASLADTRSAVKTLKNEEVGGLPAIIRLIRKLEAESHVRIEFVIKHGALSAALTNDQAVAVYRSVQESLTNMMRHSQTKEANIIFEVPAGKFFRFEVTNPLPKAISIREGFGLTSMRERIEQVGGTLELYQYNGVFCVKGIIPLVEEELEQR